MKKLLLLVGLVIFLNSNNLFAKEKNEKPIDIEDVKKLGRYEPIEEFPEGMMEKFGSCSKIHCKAKMAGKIVYHRFVVKKKSSQKYPGKMMEAMAWYEILFNGKHKDTDKFIKRYLENYPNDYKYKKVDEKFIRSLLSMNKGRKSMRKALGMDLTEKTDIAIKRFWLLGAFLGKGKAKKRVIDSELKERKILINEYKAKVKALKEKLEEKEEAENEN
jgi:hypothetical protein